MLHHMSQIRIGDPQLRENLRDAFVKGLYERAHRRVIDRVWVVSTHERRAMRWLAGMRKVDVIPNGVDADYFQPGPEVPERDTAVFWGRLDFGPNVQALQWFCREVWPSVRRSRPHARFTIIGFQPGPEVRELATLAGVTLIGDLPDLRSTVRSNAVVVLPFVSGGGIKNKLLEAAALGRPIVCTPAAMRGVRAAADAPFSIAENAGTVARALLETWSDPTGQHKMGSAAREWALTHHTWTASAREAIASLGSEKVAS
jgi:glycosyltransferase involved in cell wall biosynthesis